MSVANAAFPSHVRRRRRGRRSYSLFPIVNRGLARGQELSTYVHIAVGFFVFTLPDALASPSNQRACVPVLSAADTVAIDRAVVFLPAIGTKSLRLDVGVNVPRAVETKPIPAIVRKVLPQYAGDNAFRTGLTIVIVNPNTRRVAYLLPLHHGSSAADCLK